MRVLKLIRGLMVVLSFVCFTTMTTSCGSKKAKSEIEQQGKEYTSAYICPMHCDGSGSDKPGTCPVCGMDYEENEEHRSDGHAH